MSEVRSSDLEMGLSSSDDCVISKDTSPSTPYKSWNISCSLTGKDEKQIRDMFQFPNSIKIRIPSDEERACHSYADEVCFYDAGFTSGLRLHVHPFVRELFSYLHLALAQSTLGGSSSLAWWCGCLPMMAMLLGGTNSFIFIV